ncbi:hypothetical protein [Microbulbifer sp. TB1203]|nr:hypothetical protein [Microbulbifer sp. TB1203]
MKGVINGLKSSYNFDSARMIAGFKSIGILYLIVVKAAFVYKIRNQ